MSRAEERARAFYLPVVMVLGNPDGLYEEQCFAREHKIKGFVDGYEQAEKDLTDKAKFSSGWDGFYYGQGYKQAFKDIWHNVKDEKPELRRTVICVNELVVEAELYTDDNELDEIEHYTKWCYLDDILPKE